ncbi:MAG TPA: carboxypeptidase-like regulatory domain-containing protein, partial [Chitinophagaceae bacterium]|nr:carboxypeptidase-like regulatory domain-containing protein [Chitinophagaceae bacterium]
MEKKQHVASLRLAMKIFVQLAIALVFTGSLYANTSSAQEILDRSVSISATNTEVSKVIAKAQKQSGVKFIFSPNSIEARRKISCNVKEKPLGLFIDQVLKPLGIGYKVINDQIVLYSLKAIGVQAGAFRIDHAARTVTGVITDDKGEPLAGASVNVKNTNRYTTSNPRGEFSIEVDDDNAVLVISYTGFETREYTVGTASTVAVTLLSANRSLDEVVVVGYGTQRRKAVTGAITRVSAEEITALPVPDPRQALQGRVPGLSVVNNGSPGETP